MNKESTTVVRGELNIILKLYIYLVIANHIVGLVVTTPVMFTQVSDYHLPASLLWWNVFLHLAMIYAMFEVLRIKRIGLYALGALQVINIAVQSIDYGRDLWEMLFTSSVVCIIFALLLCLRKNGTSAWRVFFPRKKSKHQNEDSHKTPIGSKVNSDEIITPLQEQHSPTNTKTIKNKPRTKSIIAVVAGCLGVLLITLIAFLATTCDSKEIELKHNAIGEVANPLEEVYTYLKDSEFNILGTYSEFVSSLVHNYNVERIAGKLIRDRYEGLMSRAEVEAYLGTAHIYHTLYMENEEFASPVFTLPALKEYNLSFNAKYLCEGKVYRVALCDIDKFLEEYPSARPHITLKLNEVELPHKRRLLYYSLLGSKYISSKELGTVTNFLKSLSSEEKIRDFYWQLIDYGYTASEIGSEEAFCNLLSTDLKSVN